MMVSSSISAALYFLQLSTKQTSETRAFFSVLSLNLIAWPLFDFSLAADGCFVGEAVAVFPKEVDPLISLPFLSYRGKFVVSAHRKLSDKMLESHQLTYFCATLYYKQMSSELISALPLSSHHLNTKYLGQILNSNQSTKFDKPRLFSFCQALSHSSSSNQNYFTFPFG